MPRIVLSLLFAIALTGCGLKASAVGPGIERSGLVKDGEGVVVVGVVSNLGGGCELGLGPSGSGDHSSGIRLGWSEGDRKKIYGSTTLKAGRWSLYSYSCGPVIVRRARKERALGLVIKTTLEPLAEFTVFPGEVLYIGDLDIKNVEGLVRFRIKSMPDDARRALARSAPQLGDSMRTRLMKTVPRTRKPRKLPDSV